MNNSKLFYIGTKKPIGINECKKIGKTWDSRKFFQVNMVFGGDWSIDKKISNKLCKKEALKVSKYLQKHGDEIVQKALSEK
jgi:hypothetical protein